MNIRRAEPKDLTKIQQCNLHNLPENYHMKSWAYSFITWPEISYLAEDSSGRVVGYVLSSMWVKVAHIEPDEEYPWLQVGHVNSLSVLRTYRRLGLAKRLMLLSKKAMIESYNIEYIQLHVRKSNRAAFSLYSEKLGFKIHRKEAGYYGDGEDAYSMRIVLKPRSFTHRLGRRVQAFVYARQRAVANWTLKCAKRVSQIK
ncbi:putative N-terminal acetyltransferase complex subunit ARD1 [Suillus subaureus]|uniref:N-terminal acetyltransferase complex subunit ARD1 n=1 Tax=Suillus subaureus TaxID=48587 RepID=A0A9P7EJI0_9AGAM|nr:putative N-terminal acetyltransferase complex subunit ARD1 [Suillus subaureus]KAG1823748.1 putative N-terminal acetyltransferase complex subunit ARD1 [Suillus subaureus]